MVFVTNSTIKLGKIETGISVDGSAAIQLSKNYLNITGKLVSEKYETVVYNIDRSKSVVAHKISLVPAENNFGDWELIVKADGKELMRSTVGKKTATDGWMDVSIDLSAYAGDAVQIELANQANGWERETGLWAQIDLVSE